MGIKKHNKNKSKSHKSNSNHNNSSSRAQLLRQLEQPGLCVKAIEGDGNCLFRALGEY